MEKILLDTDIGSDIDDAVCLAYLLMQPECELMGITTVMGDTHKRAMLASALCRAAEKTIPIYPGARTALYQFTTPLEVSQYQGLKNHPHDTVFPENQWLDFMRNTIRQNPTKSHCWPSAL